MDSRAETLLKALIDDISLEDIDIISRVDKYLLACCTASGCDGLPKPISREDKLLYLLAEKIAGGGFHLPEQEKSIDITEVGTFTVTPDEGKVLSKVTVNVQIVDGNLIEF